MPDTIPIPVPLGAWDALTGLWYQNPYLSMSEEEQMAHNQKYGFFGPKRQKDPLDAKQAESLDESAQRAFTGETDVDEMWRNLTAIVEKDVFSTVSNPAPREVGESGEVYGTRIAAGILANVARLRALRRLREQLLESKGGA